MTIAIIILTFLWTSPVFSQSLREGCVLSSELDSAPTDADLLCHNTIMTKNNFYMLKNITTDDVETANFGSLEVDLDKNLFQKLKNLRGLLLYRCKVNVFQPESNKLQNLQMYHTVLTNHSNFNNCCSNLNKLLLRNVTGLEIEDFVFSKLNRLSQLQLLGIPTDHITQDVFQGLKSLKVLRLSDINFKQIDSDTFANLPKLRELSIVDNEIEDINTNIFKNMRSLKILTISAKKLKPIPMDALKEMKQLKVLGLPLQTWKGLDVQQIPAIFPKLTSYSYSEKWDPSEAHIYEPLFRRLSTILTNTG